MGVSIDTNPTTSPVDADLRVAYDGGGNFLERLQRLSELKEQADTALADLQLGKAARIALDDAHAKGAEASATLADAQTKADALAAAAEQIKADADSYAARIMGEADAALTAATAKLNEAEAALASHQATKDQADKARVNADARAALFDEKIAMIDAALEKTAAVLANVP